MHVWSNRNWIYNMLDSTNWRDIFLAYNKAHKELKNTPKYLGWSYKDVEDQLHMAIGLAGEGAEVLELYKKRIFGLQEEIDKEKLEKELGDVFWYWWGMLNAANLSFEDILEKNMKKLKERYENNERANP